MMFNDRLRRAPFFRLFCPLAAGIVLRSYADIPHTTLTILTVIVFFFTLIIYFICNTNLSLLNVRIFGILLNICLLCLGAGLYVPLSPEPLKPSFIVATVSKAPVKHEKTCKLLLSHVRKVPDARHVPGKVLAYLEHGDHDCTPLPGNKLLIYTDLKQVPAPANPFDSDYRKYYSGKQILYRVFIPSEHWMIIDARVPADIRFFVENYRYYLGERIIKLFPRQEENAMLIALYLGNNAFLDQEEKSSFSRAGAMHFLAVSGLHAGIVFYILQLIFRLIPGKMRTKTLRTVLIIIILWIYALLTGMTGSVTRACLMLSLWLAADLTRRASSNFNILFFSAIIILVFNPGMLYDVGFQLSYLAVAGILLFFPHASKSISKRSWLTGRLLSLGIISLAAQATTLPLSIFYFHQVSHYFLLTSILITPLIAILLYSAPLLLVSNFITCVDLPVTGLVSIVSRCILHIIDFINRLPGSYSVGYYPDAVEVGLLYMILISAYLYLFIKRKKFLLVLMISILICLLVDSWHKITSDKQLHFFVYHLHGASAVNVVSGQDNVFLPGMDTIERYDWQALQKFWDKLNTGDPHILSEPGDSIYVSGDFYIRKHPAHANGFTLILLRNISIGITGQSDPPGDKEYHFPRLDYLVIQNNCFPDIQELMSRMPFATIIIDGSNIPYLAKKWADKCRLRGMDVYNTPEEGCFHLKIPPHQQMNDNDRIEIIQRIIPGKTPLRK